MIQGAQRATENDGLNKQEITDVLNDKTKTDSNKIATIQRMFSKENDVYMARGILNDNTISLDEKVHILSALYQLARNERDEVQRKMDDVYARKVTLENEWKADISRRKKQHFESLNSEYSKMMDSAKRKADVELENRRKEIEVTIEREKLNRLNELDEHIRQFKLGEIQKTVATLEQDKTDLKGLIQKEVIDEIQAKLSEVKESIIAAEISLGELIQQSTPEVSTTPGSATSAPASTFAPAPSISVEGGVLSQAAIRYLEANYPMKAITHQRVFVTDNNNKYTQVNLNNGEYYITFDSAGNHLWTDGPFEHLIQKKNLSR